EEIERQRLEVGVGERTHDDHVASFAVPLDRDERFAVREAPPLERATLRIQALHQLACENFVVGECIQKRLHATITVVGPWRCWLLMCLRSSSSATMSGSTGV